jgi:DNA replicative helicase MCM subunit Mcm2 (Cdc46/Mcm family)
MSKEVINHLCSYCESDFKLTYDDENVTSLPKFCPFCGEETLAEDEDDQEVTLDNYDDDQEL